LILDKVLEGLRRIIRMGRRRQHLLVVCCNKHSRLDKCNKVTRELELMLVVTQTEFKDPQVKAVKDINNNSSVAAAKALADQLATSEKY
jgi:hypothetical protein